MSDPVKTRRYVSPRRDQQARRTRRTIIAAAHRLFVSNGYAPTRVEDVASEAGVAVQTIYGAIGNKRDLLWTVLETAVAGDDEPATLEQRFREELDGASDLDERLRRAVAFGAGVIARSFEAHRIMQSAAASDPGVATALAEAEERRRRDAHALTRLIADPADLDNEHLGIVADLVYAVVSYETYEHLVETCGWTAERYERWITRALRPAFD